MRVRVGRRRGGVGLAECEAERDTGVEGDYRPHPPIGAPMLIVIPVLSETFLILSSCRMRNIPRRFTLQCPCVHRGTELIDDFD